MPVRSKSNPSPVSLFRGLFCGILLFASVFWAPPAPCAPAQITTSVDTDRWLEIDLYWFKQHQVADSVRTFWDRFHPLYAGVRGYRGVILNIGWTVGPVMEWSGNLGQRISLPTGSGQQKWVDEREPLTGTTAERKKKSEQRFAGAVVGTRHGYDPWTYGDVKLLAAEMKREATRRGITGLKVGMLNYAWTDAYGEVAPWVKHHPEAFTKIAQIQPDNFSVGRYFDPGARLHADASPLGGDGPLEKLFDIRPWCRCRRQCRVRRVVEETAHRTVHPGPALPGLLLAATGMLPRRRWRPPPRGSRRLGQSCLDRLGCAGSPLCRLVGPRQPAAPAAGGRRHRPSGPSRSAGRGRVPGGRGDQPHGDERADPRSLGGRAGAPGPAGSLGAGAESGAPLPRRCPRDGRPGRGVAGRPGDGGFGRAGAGRRDPYR